MSKLTLEKIEALVEKETFIHHGTLTVCILDLKNGAVATGTSNVIDPANYDQEIGTTCARSQAIGSIWELEGYAMKTRPRGGDCA